MTDKATFIGMDLGTYKTSVVGSNGCREAILSAVGWAKDDIARALIGDIVFGEEAYQQERAVHLVRPFHKGVLKYNDHADVGLKADNVEKQKEAARLLVNHAVSKVRNSSGEVFGVIGAPSRASLANMSVLLDAARDAFDAVMIIPEPFAIAYGMNRLKDTLVVDIGGGTIDLCPMYGAFPKESDQLTIPFGGDAVDERFYELVKAQYPEAGFSLHLARQIKEKYGFVDDTKSVARATLPVDGQPREFDLTDPLKEACRVLAPPIVDGIRQLVAKFEPQHQQPLLKNIILGGGGSQLKGLDRVVEEQLSECGGANVTRVYDSVFAGATGALKLALSLPRQRWEEIQNADQEPAAA